MECIDERREGIGRDDITFTCLGEEGEYLAIKITDEGIIMDSYQEDGNIHTGTVGMTFMEWFDFVQERDITRSGF